MKRSLKIGLTSGALLFAVFALGSCTADFCSTEEKTRMLFAVEPGVSVYYESKEAAEAARLDTENYKYLIEQVYEDNPNVWRSVEIDIKNNNYAFTKSNQLSSIIKTTTQSGIARPSDTFFAKMDTKVLTAAAALGNVATKDLVADKTSEYSVDKILKDYGYTKFWGDEAAFGINKAKWGNYDLWLNELRVSLGENMCPSDDFVKVYKNNLWTVVSNSRSCIATVSGEYGSYGQDGASVSISQKDWGYAWTKGPIEGLLVYPVAWLVDSLTNAFGGVSQSGWTQLLALVIVTFIVRIFIFACTFRSTMQQQKMQALQPELSKLQAKYPNANTNQAEKQRLSQEQMALYKKNKINPLSQLLVMVIQFPVFIGVWGAMTGSAALSTGSFLGLKLSTSIWTAVSNFANWPQPGWWTAIVLFILMGGAQFVAMKLPQWMQKARNKKIAKLGKNPAQDTQGKTMKIVSYAMLAMIVVMGFTLPAAMGVYWLIGALISVLQTVITQSVINRSKKRRK